MTPFVVKRPSLAVCPKSERSNELKVRKPNSFRRCLKSEHSDFGIPLYIVFLMNFIISNGFWSISDWFWSIFNWFQTSGLKKTLLKLISSRQVNFWLLICIKNLIKIRFNYEISQNFSTGWFNFRHLSLNLAASLDHLICKNFFYKNGLG